jgi:psiF repeat-containing protein
MLRTLALAVALLPIALAATPASAVTSEEKMETCKVGAESQQLQGAKRDAFIKKCMAGGNYEPRARKNAKAAPKPQ